MKDKKGWSILVADDEEDIRNALVRVLDDVGYEVFIATTGPETLRKAKEHLPDLILLDVLMPEMDGITVKAKLNEDPFLASIPVIFVSAKKDTDHKLGGFQVNADDYVTKPFDIVELLARIRSALQKHERYEKISLTDKLTGLANIHLFKRELDLFFNIARRHHHTFSVALFDIQNIRYYNETYGHKAGDEIIKWVGESLKRSFRESDFIARYGGDEFAAIFPETLPEKALIPVERFKRVLAEQPIRLPGAAESFTVTLNTGIAAYQPDVEKSWVLFEMADKQLHPQN